MASGQVQGGMDAALDRRVDEGNVSGMAHRVKWMSDEGSMTKTNKFTRPGGGDSGKLKSPKGKL
jgi:hypothetical protein